MVIKTRSWLGPVVPFVVGFPSCGRSACRAIELDAVQDVISSWNRPKVEREKRADRRALSAREYSLRIDNAEGEHARTGRWEFIEGEEPLNETFLPVKRWTSCWTKGVEFDDQMRVSQERERERAKDEKHTITCTVLAGARRNQGRSRGILEKLTERPREPGETERGGEED